MNLCSPFNDIENEGREEGKTESMHSVQPDD